jgi:DNA-directed RNA polymerase beta' subunit
MTFETKILTFRQKRFLKASQRRVLVDSLEIGLASPYQIREWAQRRLPNKTLSGEVLTSKTVDYKTLKPIRDGLFCERIFGPIKDFVCACGKKRTSRALPFCPDCDVEHIESRVRRYRLGHIKLISPVTHVWYLRGRPSYIATLLGRKRRSIEAIAYCTTFVPEHISSPSFFPDDSTIASSMVFAGSFSKSASRALNQSFSLAIAEESEGRYRSFVRKEPGPLAQGVEIAFKARFQSPSPFNPQRGYQGRRGIQRTTPSIALPPKEGVGDLTLTPERGIQGITPSMALPPELAHGGSKATPGQRGGTGGLGTPSHRLRGKSGWKTTRIIFPQQSRRLGLTRQSDGAETVISPRSEDFLSIPKKGKIDKTKTRNLFFSKGNDLRGITSLSEEKKIENRLGWGLLSTRTPCGLGLTSQEVRGGSKATPGHRGGSTYPYANSFNTFSQPQTLPLSSTFACDLDERAYLLEYITASPLPGDRALPVYEGVQRRCPLEIVYGIRGTHLLTGEEAVQEILSYTGGEAIRSMINRFDMCSLARFLRLEMESLSLEIDSLNQFPFRDTLSKGKSTDGLGKLLKKRARQARRLRLAQLFFKSRKKPEWMTLSALPVLPPDLRPILRLDGDVLVVSDLNQLYQKVLFRNSRFRRLGIVTVESVAYAKGLLQEAVDALLDNGKGGAPPMVAPNDRPFKSLSDILKGKRGRFRQNLLGKRVDYSGRSVIVVGPKLLLHQCGLPREMGIELFQPFLIRKLLAHGFAHSIGIAKKMIQEGEPVVWDLLHQLMRQHPILLNRAPTLHRLGIQAFQPKLVQGRAILLHPLVCTAFNADFDGDQMAVHVPLSVQARAEAWKLLWSRNNILSPATGQPVLIPSQDMVLGCYYLTQSVSMKRLAGTNYGATGLKGLLSDSSVSALANQKDSQAIRAQKTIAYSLRGTRAQVGSPSLALPPELAHGGSKATPGQRGGTGGLATPSMLSSSITTFTPRYLRKVSGLGLPSQEVRGGSKATPGQREGILFSNEILEVKKPVQFFSGMEEIGKAYEKGCLTIHETVWLRIDGQCENGNDPEDPIEYQIQSSGFCKKIYTKYQLHMDSACYSIARFVQTTVGRVFVNEIVNTKKGAFSGNRK